MTCVEYRNHRIYVRQKPIPLLSGEVHYWRIPLSTWKVVLGRIKELGLEVISTYIPWNYHEYRRGKYDFSGKTDPSRNLKAFIKLAQKENLRVILRPGPYIYSEWPHEGVPAELRQYHKLHPKFLAAAEKYIAEVCRVIRPFLATQGGNVIAVQADNEIDPWPDDHGAQYGLGAKPGMFQDFLRKKYKTQFDENKAGAFSACMLDAKYRFPLEGAKELRSHLDYLEFKHVYSERYAKWCIETYRSCGIDAPIYLNFYPFFYAHDWRGLNKLADFSGIDLYPTNEFHEDEHGHRKFLDKLRFLRTATGMSYIAEFESGVWHGHHVKTGMLSPTHYRLAALSALMAGVKGWNWYMLVNRDNWYMSPITEQGRKREELFRVFKEIVEIYKRIDPPSLERIVNVGVTYHPPHYAARQIRHKSSAIKSLYDADIDYELYDPEQDEIKMPILFYSGCQWLSRKGHENLLNYVEKGGILVAFQDFPRKDENFELCSLVGFEEPTASLFEFKKTFNLKFGKNVFADITSSVYVFDAASAGAHQLRVTVPGYGSLVIGYEKKIGKGRLFHLGVEPAPDLIRAIMKYYGIVPPSMSNVSSVKTALLRKGKQKILIAVNVGDEDKNAVVTLASRKTLSAFIPRKDGMASITKL